MGTNRISFFVGGSLGLGLLLAYVAANFRFVPSVSPLATEAAPQFEPLVVGTTLILPKRDTKGRLIPQSNLVVVAMPPCGSCSKFTVTFEEIRRLPHPVVLAIKGDLKALDSRFSREAKVYVIDASSVVRAPSSFTHYTPQLALLNGAGTIVACSKQSADVERLLKEFAREKSNNNY